MRRIVNILSKNWVLVIVTVIGIFLRFYKLGEFATFLGDQGRDAIILKRIITFEHFPAIGAPTSIGQVYLGPFYYYFIAPWLAIFKLNPIGPIIGVATFSSLYLVINYLIVKDLVDKKTALASTVFISFSSILIELSRFSWNPNLLPLFTLLTLYFFVKSIKNKHWYFFSLTGAFLSFSIQLHYLALFLVPAIVLFYLFDFIKDKKKIMYMKNFAIHAFSFILFSSPLIVFDLRHEFLNAKNFVKLFQESSTGLITKLNSLIESFYYLNLYSFNLELNRFFIYILLILIGIVSFSLIRQKSNIKFFAIFFLLTLILMSFYSGQKHPHYFGILYPIYFVVVAYFLVFSGNSVFGKFIFYVFMFGFVFLNFNRYPYFSRNTNSQIVFAEKIAKKIFTNIEKEKFTVTALPEKYSDSTYRYFLEIWGKRAIEKDSLEKADELFLVCEKQCDPVIGNPQWDIAFFAPTKIAGVWNIDGVKIYKLIR